MKSIDSKTNNTESLQTRGFENIIPINAKSGTIVLGTEAFMRERNEDRLVVDLERDAFAVIDGMGGYSDGDRCADCVERALKEGIENDSNHEAIHFNAHELMRDSGLRGGACYVAVKIEEGKRLKIWYAGDADVVVVDSKGNMKFHNGDININQAPGARNLGKSTVEYVHLKNYDRIILASDGLWDNLPSREEAFKKMKDMPIDQALKWLVEVVRVIMNDSGAGNKDNLSIILYEILPNDLLKR